MDERSMLRQDEHPPSLTESLSPRERQLLTLAAEGSTDNGIAHRLGISLATVGTYWGRIRIKFGPLNRTELVAVFLREEAAKALGELRSENERLLQQLQDHAKAATMLRTSLEMFRGLIETAPDAILLVNKEGVIELANEQAEEMFGYGPNELLGVHIDQLVPSEYRDAHVKHREEYNESPTKRRMAEHLATEAVRKDGTKFRMATALSATQTPAGPLVTCIVRDLTNRFSTGSAGE